MRSDSGSKIATIIGHEYMTRVRSKGFIISTVLGPVLILAFIGIMAAIQVMSMDSTNRKLAIIDQTGIIGAKVAAIDTAKYFLTKDGEEDLKAAINNEKIDGYLLIDSNFMKTGETEVFSKGGGGIGFITSLENNLKDILYKERLKKMGADDATIKMFDKGVTVKTQKVTQKGTEKDFTAASAVFGYILGLMVYMMMLIYGAMVMRGVIEEKANRIIEVLVSSAKPMEIMMGKVLGIGAVGLTQVVFWVAVGLLLLSVGVPIADSLMSRPDIPMQAMQPGMQNPHMIADMIPTTISPWLIVGLFYYFLIGYFIYAALYAGIGSAVDQESDAQQLSAVITLPVMIPVMLVGSIINNPDGTMAIVLSLIPFFSPILMLVRAAATDVPVWQIALSVVLTLLTLVGSIWAASRVYRIGILIYGVKPKIGDLLKWMLRK